MSEWHGEYPPRDAADAHEKVDNPTQGLKTRYSLPTIDLLADCLMKRLVDHPDDCHCEGCFAITTYKNERGKIGALGSACLGTPELDKPFKG